VQASRARILAAGDEERRRLERDLHDGAQQRLLATRLALQLVRDRAAGGDANTTALLDEADAEVQGALEDIRAFARGLHPAILSEDGLAAALGALARRSPIPLEVGGVPVERLPAAVETAAYFLVAEALANAAKHAAASRVHIDIQRRNGHAVVLVDDDGVGGATPTPGGGLSGLRDRIEALGGRFAVSSPPGGGTQLRAEIPCA
jgi:signal transduction histidine kinase